MIPARHAPWFQRWFGRQVERRIFATFGEVSIRGLSRLESQLKRGPVIVVSNHTSFWDPMFSIYLNTRLCPFEGYAWMEAKNLQKRPFLGRLGGFGVDRNNSDSVEWALDYAKNQLAGPQKLVWIFPQGSERPSTERPLRFFSGAARLAQNCPQAKVVPLALRYEFGSHEKPSMLVSFGSSVQEASPEAQARAVEHELEVIDRHLKGEPLDFVSIRSRSGGSWFSNLAEKLLSKMTRYKELTA